MAAVGAWPESWAPHGYRGAWPILLALHGRRGGVAGPLDHAWPPWERGGSTGLPWLPWGHGRSPVPRMAAVGA